MVNSCLIKSSLHKDSNSPRKNSPPLSDLTISTNDGFPSARTLARKLRKALAASDLCLRKYIHVRRMQSSLTIMGYALPPTDARKYIHVRRMQPSLAIMGYSLPPTDATSFRPPRSTKLYVTFYLIYISFHEQFPFDKPSPLNTLCKHAFYQSIQHPIVSQLFEVVSQSHDRKCYVIHSRPSF